MRSETTAASAPKTTRALLAIAVVAAAAGLASVDAPVALARPHHPPLPPPLAQQIGLLTGSALPVPLLSGSSLTGSSLGLGSAYAGTGSAATGSAAPATGSAALGGGLALGAYAKSLGLGTGSALAPCTGSAALGSAAVLAGLLTGSSLLDPGSADGSVVVGSAVTGSSVLACLLLLPGNPPPAPGIPLLPGPPPAPPAPPAAQAPPAPPAVAAVAPAVVPPKPVARKEVPPPWTAYVRSLPVKHHQPAWNLLEFVTITVVVVFGLRSRSVSARPRRMR